MYYLHGRKCITFRLYTEFQRKGRDSSTSFPYIRHINMYQCVCYHYNVFLHVQVSPTNDISTGAKLLAIRETGAIINTPRGYNLDVEY